MATSLNTSGLAWHTVLPTGEVKCASTEHSNCVDIILVEFCCYFAPTMLPACDAGAECCCCPVAAAAALFGVPCTLCCCADAALSINLTRFRVYDCQFRMV